MASRHIELFLYNDNFRVISNEQDKTYFNRESLEYTESLEYLANVRFLRGSLRHYLADMLRRNLSEHLFGHPGVSRVSGQDLRGFTGLSRISG